MQSRRLSPQEDILPVKKQRGQLREILWSGEPWAEVAASHLTSPGHLTYMYIMMLGSVEPTPYVGYVGIG